MLRLLSPLFIFSFLLTAFAASGNLQASAQYSDQARYVRVTTGARQFRDWEQPLINGNPNLSHFTWVPVTGYTQGRQRVVQVKGPDSKLVQVVPGARRRNIYVNPIAVPNNYIANRPANPDVHGAIRVPTVMPQRAASASEQGAVHGAIRLPLPANSDLAGKLAHQNGDQGVSARMSQPQIASYPAVSGNMFAPTLYGEGSSKSVHGMLKSAFRDR